METATRAVVSVKFMTGAVERVWMKKKESLDESRQAGLVGKKGDGKKVRPMWL